MAAGDDEIAERLEAVQAELRACTRCPRMQRPVVHGAPVASRILLIGQAPGPREGALGRPFAWTAGKTLFRWLGGATGASEEELRAKIYIAAVARCFPGKAPSGGDRKPDAGEIEACRSFLVAEAEILQPHLVLAIGSLAIEQVLGRKPQLLTEVVGTTLRVAFHGRATDLIALPHPSGVSTWHKREPGATLLAAALGEVARHPAVVAAFGRGRSAAVPGT